MRAALAALLLALPGLAARAEGVRVAAVPSKTELTVGESFTVELRAWGPAGTTYAFPAEAGDEQVELRALPAEPSPAPAAPDRLRYQAAAFALKDARVPGVTVRYRLPDGSEGAATSEPVPLHMGSLLPKDPKEQSLADIREPVGLRVGRAFWIALGLAGAALLGLVLWAVRRRRRPAPAAPAAPAQAADDEARRALEALLASGLISGGQYRPFYIALTEIAKRYLERRLAAPVLEMTSAEMAGFLRAHPHGQAFASPLRDLSTAADQIKFAKGDGQAEEALRHSAVVRELIAGLEARLAPPYPGPLPASRGEGSAGHAS